MIMGGSGGSGKAINSLMIMKGGRRSSTTITTTDLRVNALTVSSFPTSLRLGSKKTLQHVTMMTTTSISSIEGIK